MKLSSFIFLPVVVASSALGSVVSPGLPALLSRFAAGMEEAKTQGRGIDLESWSDIEALPFELQVRMLGTHVPDQPNVSDYFVIVPRGERAKFPKGSLLVISATPFNLTAWHREWYQNHRNYTDEQLTNYDKANPQDEIVRWYLMEDKEGKYARASIAEEDLRKIMEQTGLTIPVEPEPYRFNMSQVDPATGRPINAPAVPTHSAAAPKSKAVTTPTPTPAPITTTTVKSPNLLLWIVGAVAALASIVLIVRRKKLKA